jgi:hypothetical protein
MALYLEGKTPMSTNDLSPEEATQMSYDVKYIGMDVHKEAIVIAVLNGSGKLVMESIGCEKRHGLCHDATLNSNPAFRVTK